MSDVETLNRLLARKASRHQVLCIEGPDHLWCVECQVCTEDRAHHPNLGGRWTRPAPFGEEQAASIALDHLSRLGYEANRFRTRHQARAT